MKCVVILVVLCAGTAFSQTYYMNIRMRGGGTTSIPLDEIRKLTFSSVNDVQDEKWSTVVKTFTLLQNYPNPFNPTTTIQFTIVNRQLTVVKVYDILGKEVATLLNEEKSPGTHSVLWDARGASSGVYFYRIRAGDFVQTKRMVLLR